MKKIFLLLILCISFAFATIDETKTDVYFGNGILTSRADAIYNTFEVLEPAIKEELYGNNEDEMYKHIGKVYYAYNRTVSFFWDIFESGYQIANLQEFVDKGYELIKKTKATIHSIDLKRQVDKYEESIKA